MNTCMWAGSVGLTVSPSEELSDGHVAPAEQHQLPSALIWSAMMLLMTLRQAVSRGMNIAPTA